MTSTECIDEDALLGFVEHQLSQAEAAHVSDHLARCGECRQVLAELARQTNGGPGAGEPLRKGSLLGRYVLGEVLGVGGMGLVYAADDPALGRRVAIKVLRESGSGTQAGMPNPRFELMLAEQAQQEALERGELLVAASPNSVMARADVADSLRELGTVRSLRKQWAAAQLYQERALALFDQLIIDSPRSIEALASRASLQAELGQTHAALGHAELACSLLGRSKASWFKLRADGLLPPADSGAPELAERALARCK